MVGVHGSFSLVSRYAAETHARVRLAARNWAPLARALMCWTETFGVRRFA